MVKEYLIKKGLFTVNAFFIIASILLVIFLAMESIPIISGYNIIDFILGLDWAPDNLEFGIFPMIVSSLLITAIALVMAVPLSISCAVYLEEIASENVKKLFKPIIQTLAGIPSVIYGFFGLSVIAPFLRDNFGGSGFSVFTASVILAVMILPTIISVSQDSIKSVPDYYKEASFGLGSTHWQVIKNIIIPTALPGIVVAVILGIARAIGETLAVLMLVGNVNIVPASIFSEARTLTSNIALEMGYATGIHYSALFMSAFVLFVMIIVLMSISLIVQHKLKRC
jgi:phosphate transport system permease protein